MAAKSEGRRATYADLAALPENMVGELISGVLYAMPRPATPHASAAMGLSVEIGGPFGYGKGGPGGWVILVEPELHFGEDVLVPDLAGWRRERMPELPHAPAIELPPDWVCEILSPSTTKHDRLNKRPVYATQGVEWLWFVDPIERVIEVFRLDGGRYSVTATFADDAKARIPPFDAIEIDVAVFWAR